MKVETIVQKLKNGDMQILRLVLELFNKSVFQAAFFITNDTSLAEDAVHEVFLKLSNRINQLEDPSKLEAWLCRMASNTAKDIIRHRSRIGLFAEARDVYSDNQKVSPETVLLINEEKKVIKQYIERLQSEYKIVIYLKYYQDLPVNEISKILGIPLGTVKSRLIRARAEIRKIMDPENHFNLHNISSLADWKRFLEHIPKREPMITKTGTRRLAPVFVIAALFWDQKRSQW
ncbi:MAG: RNA polymerase sigma factor, partial [Desulfotomaculaceae bacterium]|nr:RNA polymerase sigma factor [Desulfotomaculaceae bacterium]